MAAHPLMEMTSPAATTVPVRRSGMMPSPTYRNTTTALLPMHKTGSSGTYVPVEMSRTLAPNTLTSTTVALHAMVRMS